MRMILITVFLGLGAGACRTGGDGSDLAAKEPVYAVPKAPINCGTLDPAFNAENRVGKRCWADEKNPAARCYVEDSVGNRTEAACDDPKLFACLGALGSGCGLHGAGIADLPCEPGPDPLKPWEMHCIVAVGSLLHDACCADANRKKVPASGCLGNWGVVPGRTCDDYWQEASFDRARGFYWWVLFDTRARIAPSDYRAIGVDTPYVMRKLGLKAPPDAAIGGIRYAPVPNLVEAAWQAAVGSRTTTQWGAFCQSGEITDSTAAWTQGVAYCK